MKIKQVRILTYQTTKCVEGIQILYAINFTGYCDNIIGTSLGDHHNPYSSQNLVWTDDFSEYNESLTSVHYRTE
jgi:hypothetical protein